MEEIMAMEFIRRLPTPEEIKKSVEAIKDRKGKPRTRPFSAPALELRGKENFFCAW